VEDKDADKLVQITMKSGINSMERLLSHEPDVDVLWRSFLAIRREISIPDVLEEVISSALPLLVVRGASRYPKHLKVQLWGAALLHRLCKDDSDNSLMERLMNHDALLVLLSTCRDFLTEKELVREALGAIAFISCKHGQDKTLFKGLPQLLLAVSQEYPDHPAIQTHVCHVVNNFARGSAATRQEFAAHPGMCKAILQALEGHPEDMLLVTTGWFAIGSLCQGNKASTQEFLAISGPEFLCTAWQQHLHYSKKMRDAISYTMWAVLSTESGANNQFSTANIVELSVLLLERYQEEMVAVTHCISMLCLLVYKNRDHRKRFLDANGPRAIISAKLSATDDCKLHCSAAETVLLLSSHDGRMAEAFGVAGACDSVVRSLREFSDPAMIDTALQCLAVLAYESEWNRRRLVSLDMLPLVFDKANAHVTDCGVMASTASLLRSLATGDDDVCQRIEQLGGFELILDSLLRFPSEKELQGRGFELLSMRPAFVLANTSKLDFALDVLRRFRDDPIVIYFWRVLMIIAGADNKYYGVYGKLGLVEVVIEALKSLPFPRVQLEALPTLLALVTDNIANAYRAVNANLLEFIIENLQTEGSAYNENDSLKSQALQVASALTTQAATAQERLECADGVECCSLLCQSSRRKTLKGRLSWTKVMSVLRCYRLGGAAFFVLESQKMPRINY